VPIRYASLFWVWSGWFSTGIPPTLLAAPLRAWRATWTTGKTCCKRSTRPWTKPVTGPLSYECGRANYQERVLITRTELCYQTTRENTLRHDRCLSSYRAIFGCLQLPSAFQFISRDCSSHGNLRSAFTTQRRQGRKGLDGLPRLCRASSRLKPNRD
jgi:hypothetical protein